MADTQQRKSYFTALLARFARFVRLYAFISQLRKAYGQGAKEPPRSGRKQAFATHKRRANIHGGFALSLAFAGLALIAAWLFARLFVCRGGPGSPIYCHFHLGAIFTFPFAAAFFCLLLYELWVLGVFQSSQSISTAPEGIHMAFRTMAKESYWRYPHTALMAGWHGYRSLERWEFTLATFALVFEIFYISLLMWLIFWSPILF